MSLRDAVKEIADGMQKELEDMKGDGLEPTVVFVLKGVLGSKIDLLRTALKASEGEEGRGKPVAEGTAEILKQIMQKNEEKIKEGKRAAQQEELSGESFALCRGGVSDGTMIPVSGNPPEGAKTLLTGQVYVFHLSERQWVYSQEETEKYHVMQKKS